MKRDFGKGVVRTTDRLYIVDREVLLPEKMENVFLFFGYANIA